MRPLVLLASLMLSALSGAGLTWLAPGAQVNDCIVTDGVQVRSGPSLRFGVVGVTNAGDCFDVQRVEDTTDEGRWVQLQTGQWVQGQHIVIGNLGVVLTPMMPPTVMPTEIAPLPVVNTPRAPSDALTLRWRVVVEVYAAR